VVGATQNGDEQFSKLARAKVNLTLHVGRIIADVTDPYYGYHPLDSLVVFADIGDQLTAKPASKTTLTMTGPFAKGLEAEADNLILRAIAATRAYADVPHFDITLVKNLPVSAGLGGGSANAAAMLRILQKCVTLSDDLWSKIALSLGADVPVCLLSRSAHMTGIGEGVINIEGLAQTPAVLVNPRVPTPTGAVFQAFDKQTGLNAPRETPRPQLSEGDMLARSLDGRNDLEPPAIAAVPLINDVLRVLSVQSGSQIARMSGSGASCFALFERQAQAELAAKTIAKSHPNWWVTPCRFGEPD
jgi:4-diphosphocytidyl-2-C-methyl-D-erythritol kinase